MRWSENSKAANPSWKISQIHQQILGPLTSTHGCPFIVQVQPRQVVPFGHFNISCPYLILPTHSIFF